MHRHGQQRMENTEQITDISHLWQSIVILKQGVVLLTRRRGAGRCRRRRSDQEG